ncbi:MAG: hypothetical protein ACI9G1_002792 [Pirellulaceae bacterium]|jgi:hypothetical protein
MHEQSFQTYNQLYYFSSSSVVFHNVIPSTSEVSQVMKFRCAFSAFLIVFTFVAVSPAEEKWKPLFDGKTLKNWKVTNFGGEGEVTVEKGGIMKLDFGSSLSGVTYTDKVPTSNYEIELEAKRLDGVDFFCGLTFPVDKQHCSLIVGGWAGAVVGISSIDGKDASENATTQFINLKNDQWYHVRLRVTDKGIQVWLDKKQIINQATKGKKITVRPEVELSRPLGICTWETKAALRNIRIRTLDKKELK